MAPRSVADAEKQPLDGDVLIQVIPMDSGAAAAELVMLALGLVGMQEAREEGELGGLQLARKRIHSVSLLQSDGVSAIP
jgi:hypothetical protein